MTGSPAASMVEVGLAGNPDERQMAKTDRPVWRTTLRCGAVSATAGLLVALLLYLLNPLIGFPAWCLLIWPSAIMLMALSGMSEGSAQLWWLAIVASNALFYFLVSVFLAPLIILLRRSRL